MTTRPSTLLLSGLLCCCAVIAAPTIAAAAPVTWTVPPTTLPDGAIVSGTFVYDTSTSAITNVNITQTVVRPGAYRFLANFPNIYRGGQRTATVALNDETWFVAVGGIPANGGTYVSSQVGTGTCVSQAGGVCTAATTSNRANNVTITTVAAATVPTMTEWAMILFGTILAGGAALAIQRRRLTA